MLGNFIYGKCSLSEAFWKYSFLGLTIAGFLSRILMTMLKQTMNYDTNFFRVVINSLSFIQMNTSALAFLAFYIASFIALLVYSIICIVGMWRTYKEYDKSKTLAFICMMIVWVMVYFAVKYALY